MTKRPRKDWPALCQEALAQAIEDVVTAFGAAKEGKKMEAQSARPPSPKEAEFAALHQLERELGLSPFEMRVLVMAAAMEVDGRLPALCSALSSEVSDTPTLAMALAVFADGTWQAVAPSSPLMHWRLISLGNSSSLVHSPIRIDPDILSFLLGRMVIDTPLLPYLDRLPEAASLSPSQRKIAERVAALLDHGFSEWPPIIQLVGLDDGGATGAAAAAICETLQTGVVALAGASLPTLPTDLDIVIRHCERIARLSHAALVLNCGELDTLDPHDAAIRRLAERLTVPVILTGRVRRSGGIRPMLTFEIGKPTPHEQRDYWREALGEAPVASSVASRLAAQFHLNLETIASVCIEAKARVETGSDIDPNHLDAVIWDSVRLQSRPKMDSLAQRVEASSRWDDLVLPGTQMKTLKAIAAQLNHRSIVHDEWGMAAGSDRGLGLTVLFSGSSGTGKTTAAEVLANELRLDLYRVDLSQVISKYIGETEKNLRRVFDAADEGGVVLLFDEADALFGKRTEVTSSHDRHANVEVGYLLQRVETFRGLAILTTNHKANIDTAFQRRLRFIVHFPFPDAAMRAKIWARIYPPEMPTEKLDYDRLAQLVLSGGQIRSVALNAAFLAADNGHPLGLADIKAAARMEYAKQEKTLSDAELRGWVV